ncbi:MAG: helicase [Proteobacteria bacterium]|nr:MAG: helicase [Pseudomonadota bacterium]
MIPSPGQIVHVRSREYLVEEVIPPRAENEQTLVRLACLEDDAQGEPLEVLWEKELDARVRSANAWTRLDERGFDPPRLFASYLDALRWHCVTATDPRLFQAPYRAGIQLHAYQLEPLRKALREPRVNLFIADDVGLGKTIEAGLVLRELLMRQKVRRAVVSCPPSVMLQWRDELEQRFGLSFVIYDRRFVAAQRRERGFGVNPWTTHSRFLISHALLRDEDYAAGLRDWLGDFSPGSLLILDEAHNAAPASGSRYAVDSHLTQVVRELAPRFEHRLFLSATPHNGHSNSFAALLEILDPLRFCRGVPVKSAKLLDAVMVRRLKSDLREVVGGLPERKLVQVDVIGLPGDAPDLALPALLEEYAELREARFAGATRSAQVAAALVVSSLQKRLLSSIEAFACTLAVHQRALDKEVAAPHASKKRSLAKQQRELLEAAPGRDDDRAELSEDEASAEERGAVAAATVVAEEDAGARVTGAECDLLARMAKIADAARGLADARVEKLVAWIREHCCPSGRWNERRVLIFTEYADTKRYLEAQLRDAFAATDRAGERIRTFHGGMSDDSREEVKRAFNAHPAKHPLRILIATDAAREGVNLQNHCADLFHFDVPWNPMRIEQRNGRIDRKLQRASVVRCHYFFYAQRPEDPVLQALVRKTETIERELGSLSPVLERRLSDKLGGRIRRDRARALAHEIEAEEASAADRATVEEELEAVRERQEQLAAQLDQLRTQLGVSQRYLGLDTERLTSAVSASLEIAAGASLAAEGSGATYAVATSDRPERGDGYVAGPPRPIERFVFPPLDRLPGADPSWADTLDALRPPKQKGVSPHEWRREAPIRPVVFEAPDTLDDDVVQLHLEHRVVRRLLGRFLAQGFVHDDLARACVGQVRDAIPRAVLLGRLSLYGPGATRLHDEVIAVAARWTEPAARKEPLRPYAERAEAESIKLLDASLVTSGSVAAEVQAKLVAASRRDVAELVPHLEARARETAERAAKLLAERGEREARDLRALIESQRIRIEAECKTYDPKQLGLFEAEERRQKEADRRYWDKRLAEIPDEIEREPARVRRGYEVAATRVEPVGMVYLWPVTG